MQYRHLCWPPTFPWPRSSPPTFKILESPLVLNCAAVRLSVIYSPVLTYNLIFLQLWLLGRSVERILYLHPKLERWYFKSIQWHIKLYNNEWGECAPT